MDLICLLLSSFWRADPRYACPLMKLKMINIEKTEYNKLCDMYMIVCLYTTVK